MKQIIHRLLKIQFIIAVILVLVTALLPYRVSVFSVAVGCGLSLLTTLITYSFFRRNNDFFSAKIFYEIMVIIGLVKWLTILFLGTALIKLFKIQGSVNNFEYIGIIIGFGLTYLSYFWLVLKV